MSDKVPLISQHESHQLRELKTPTLQTLENLQSRLTTHLHAIDVDSLLHVDHTTRNSPLKTRWHKIVLILNSIILLLGLLYFQIRSHSEKRRCASTRTQHTEGVNSPPTPLNKLELQNHGLETLNTVVFPRY
jgi:hypothetical protein